MWTIVGLVCVLTLYFLSRIKAGRTTVANDTTENTHMSAAPQPVASDRSASWGIMDAEPRRALSPEQRVEYLRIAYFIPMPNEYQFLHRYDGGKLPALSDKVMRALQMATTLFEWRALDLPHPTDRIEILNALMRDTIADNGGQFSRSNFEHDLAPLQDDEIRSLYKLYWFPEFSGEKRDVAHQTRIMAGVANQRALNDMVQAGEINAARGKKVADAGAAWLDEAGGTNEADHLIAGGWLPFLQSLDGPDIQLWHQITTDFHDLGGDRLDAVYWIMEQPECDRTTAWSFIAGMVSWELLNSEINSDMRENTTARRNRFEALLDRWNSGFYCLHSIATDGEEANGHQGLGLDDLQASVDQLMKKYEQPPLQLPSSLEVDLSMPKDDMARSIDTGLEFFDEEGLCLRMGQKWAKPEWRPNS